MIEGMICLWYGAILAIPAGYVLCDGNNGTPDLRNKFIVGAGGAYPVNDTGGSQYHTHTFTTDGHNHAIPAGSGLMTGDGYATTSDTKTDTGTTDGGVSQPPYHALAYIMKT